MSTVAGYNVRKAAQVAAFFALKEGKKINVLKLVKLIYLSDRDHLEAYDSPILYDWFVSMDHGPVNTRTLNYMNGLLEDDAWKEFVTGRANNYVGVSKNIASIDDLDELSNAEIGILEQIWLKFGDMDRYEIRAYTHEHCPEWENPHGSSDPIPYERILKFLSKENSGIISQAIEENRLLSSAWE